MPSEGSTSLVLVRMGLVLVLVGVVATLVALAPLVTGDDPFPVGVYLLAMLAPVGLGLILFGLWQRARTRHHRLAARRET